MPADCQPVIVTDAGFKVPWLKQIRKLGWHYIARVRGNQTLQLPDSRAFISVGQLYKKARTTPKCHGGQVLRFAPDKYEVTKRKQIMFSGRSNGEKTKKLNCQTSFSGNFVTVVTCYPPT